MIQIFRVFIPTSVFGLLLSEIVLVFLCYLTPVLLQAEDPFIYMFYENGLSSASLATAIVIIGLHVNDGYGRVRIQSRVALLQKLCLVLGIEFLFEALLSYLNLGQHLTRQSMLVGSVMCLISIPLWRTVYAKVALEVLGAERILLVGEHPLHHKLAHYLADHPEFAMRGAGFIGASSVEPGIPGVPTLGALNDLSRLMEAEEFSFDRVIVGLTGEQQRQGIELMSLRRVGFRIESVSDAYEAVFGRVPLSEIQPLDSWLWEQPHYVPLRLQFVYSVLIAAVLLALLSPVMLLVALAIRLFSTGPILSRQPSLGRNRNPFTLYKFNTLECGAKLNGFLRTKHLDLTPQLWNVLRGEMYLVGPRPQHVEFASVLAAEIPFYSHRFILKPGLIGWEQLQTLVHSLDNPATHLECDLYYLKNFSTQLDIFILLHSIKKILTEP